MADQQSSNSAVFAVVTFYMCSALIMVMTNKWVLNSSELPLTFLFFQLSLSVVCLLGLSLLPSTHRFAFSPPRWNRQTIIAVAPVCTANVVGLAFNIYCLKLVDASYFQVARGLTLPMTVVLQSMMTGDKPTWGTIASCGIVTWGFTYSFLPNPASFLGGADVAPIEETIVGSGPEAPMLGMVFGVLSAAMVAIHAVLIKAALKHVDGKTLDLAYWSNALSAIALIPGIAVSGELGGMWRLVQGEEGHRGAFVLGTVVTGLVGFLICVAGLLSIKVTSPVTHMFSSAVRSVLQTMLGVWLFKDVLNANRVVSIFLILAGSLLYTYIKSRPRLAAPEPPSAAAAERHQEEAKGLLSPSDLEKGTPQRRRSTSPGPEGKERED